MAILGVLTRVHTPERERISQTLARIDGTSTFSVDEDERLGVLIERDTLEEARRVLSDEVENVAGVLGAWPVFSHFESDAGQASKYTVP